MTQDRARLGKAVPCIYAIISSTIEEGQSQTGGRKFIQQLFLLLLLLTGKRNFTAVSNFPLAKCYKYSPPSPFTELVCDSFLPFRLLVSNCGYQYSSKAFLFSLVNMPGLTPVKLFQNALHSSGRYSIYSCSSYGPTFGGGNDIYIASYASSSSKSYSNLGYTYRSPPGHSYSSSSHSFLAGSRSFKPDEVEVFYETT